MIMSTKEICKRGLSMTISLTLGNTTLPFGNGFVADGKLFSQLPLGQGLGPTRLRNEFTDFALVHLDLLLSP